MGCVVGHWPYGDHKVGVLKMDLVLERNGRPHHGSVVLMVVVIDLGSSDTVLDLDGNHLGVGNIGGTFCAEFYETLAYLFDVTYRIIVHPMHHVVLKICTEADLTTLSE